MISISIVHSMMYGQISARQESSGFTVVEVVVALALFSMAVILLVLMAQAVQYSQRQSIYTNVASRAAQAKIAEYQRAGYTAYSVGDSEDFSGDDMLEGLPTGKVAVISVSQPALAQDSKELEVTITYPAGSTTKTVKMKAYLVNGGGA